MLNSFFNTIFKKQLIVYLTALSVSFLLLGLILSQVMSGYFTTQKENVLIGQGEKIAQLYMQAATANGWYYGAISLNQINREIEILKEYLDASLLITDFDLSVMYTTTDIDIKIAENLNLKTILSTEDIEKLKEGETITTTGKLGGVFAEQVLTVGYPIMIRDEAVGAIFMNSSIPELKKTIREAVSIILLCLLVSAIISFVLIYISSKSISKPLRQMNAAAKIIANGNFEKRIDLKSVDEIGQLAESFNNMAESLHKQEEQRREFIANISHDLRSPLTSMKGFLQAISDGTVPPEKQDYYINIVLDETDRLSKLANDLLDLNKLEALKIDLNITNFDINALIRATMPNFEKRVKDKAIETELRLAQETTHIKADYDKIQRVLYNLIDNAVKFTHSGGKIGIETSIINGMVKIAVSDNGDGISPEEQKRIFERFYKVDSSRGKDKRGSGLGLSIVKEFIKAHGQSIDLDSKLGEGACFSFSLPLSE